MELGFGCAGIFHLVAEFQESLPWRADWLEGLGIREIQTVVFVSGLYGGQACTCRAVPDVPGLNLITVASAGRASHW